ncbi:hypothetical protein [Streptosporangium carneum]|uniref:Uncharacterized protein n=1 Tax=Streptosporangium carneum TaxID=47481 RepID=A0A9W6I874_9ACTN|nr:hypothetical protein [Streptosporangium carneum]GLK12989.1 hypothetical protein GCM10017600_63990 [Streptosporangium carneum]
MTVPFSGDAGESADVVGHYSPFTGMHMPEVSHIEAVPAGVGLLESPFGTGLTGESPDRAEEAAAELLDTLQDEDFTDALEHLVDEAAAQYLGEQGAWSATPSETDSRAALEEWLAPLAAAAEQAVDGLVESLSTVDLHAMTGSDLETFLASAGEAPLLGSEGFDEFLGGLVRKAKKLIKGAADMARKGVAAVGRMLPVGALLNKLKALVRPLLRRVLMAALNKLPPTVRPVAKTLAAKLGLGEASEAQVGPEPVAGLSAQFDLEMAALLLAPDTLDEVFEADGMEAGTDGEGPDRLAELDDARARLAQQLTDLPAGTPPAAEIEQFLPVVLAARPLIKLGVSLIGRDRIVRFIADRIAGLVKGLIGSDAARTISRPIVDVGLRMLGLEVPAEQERALAGEALASTVEGTVLRLLELPAGVFEDELQLDAALQEAFAEAAAAYLPDRLLRPDLPERETAGEGGVWVLMPRVARPRFRFRRYTRTFVVPVSRQLARCVPWSDGGTLETHLLDRGVERWPVQAEIDLYEALPGTHLGHFTQDEVAGGARPPDSGEYEYLTADIAGLLLGEPALGRRAWYGRAATVRPRPMPGDRYFRVRIPGTARWRRYRRILVRLDAAGQLRVTVRLSERQAQQILARLERSAPAGRRDLPSVLLMLRGQYGRILPAMLAARMLKRSLVVDQWRARTAADRVVAALTAGLSAFLTKSAAQLAAAVRDPADGVTITLTVDGLSREKVTGELPPAAVTVQPGRGRG